MEVVYKEIDPKTIQLVSEALKLIAAHWLKFLDKIEFVIVKKPFNQFEELKEVCDQIEQNGKIDWDNRQGVWFKEGEKVKFYIRYNYDSIWSNSDYYFKKEFFAVLALILWYECPSIKEAVFQEVTGIAIKFEELALLAFRDTFSRYFLNPDYLRERKEDAWSFILRVDKRVKQLANSRRGAH